MKPSISMPTRFAALILLTLAAMSGRQLSAATLTPLPQDKPVMQSNDSGTSDTTPATPSEVPKEPVPTGGPPYDQASALACEARLGRKGVAFRVLDPIKRDNGCGAQRPLLIESLGRDIGLTAGITARCSLALALATWAQDTVAPAAKLHLDADLSEIAVGTSYQCRRRNNAATGKFSEHAFANGLDLTGFRFKSRPPVGIEVRDGLATPDRAFQAAARGAACAYFTTVLGPGSNAAHQHHLHIDMAFRSGGYRLCQ